MDVVGLNIGMDMTSMATVVAMAETFRAWIKSNSNDYMQVGQYDDIKTAKQSGKLGIFFDLEGGTSLGGRLEMVQSYYDLGVRWMLMAYNKNNDLAGGCHDKDQGLTEFGRNVLVEMNRVGMLPCCSHMGERSALEICERSSGPVILSHSNPRALCNHPRNVSNQLINACAGTGGVIGLNGIGIFLGNNDCSIDTFVRHIDHVVQLVGVEHVGLGLDYVFDKQELEDWITGNPDSFPIDGGYATGMNMIEPERLPDIAEALAVRGYKEDNIAAIFGNNFGRLAQQIWQ